MNMTAKIKQYLIDNCGLKADATEVEAKSALADAVMSGKITGEKLAEITKSEADDSQARITKLVDDSFSKHFAAIEAKLDALTTKPGATAAEKMMNTVPGGEQKTETQVRVKSIAEQFSTTKSTATWDKSTSSYSAKHFGGRRVDEFVKGLQYGVDLPSELDLAVIGATFKAKALKAMGHEAKHKMRDIDNRLLEYAAHECKFVGEVGGYEYDGEKLSDLHRKAVLDDSTSGGLEVVPIEFDSALILKPLLNGELFPYVNVRNVTRRRIEAAIVENPTLTWGTGEGTAISLFDTDSFITAFDNNIYTVTGAIELGEDFLGDSPTEIGRVVVNNYGESFKKELDTVIANGDGTSQPEGIFNKSGVSAITPVGGNDAAQVIGDYEALMFGVNKEYLDEAGRGEGSRAVFLGTQTSYSRARGIPVGSSDARRIFGMDEQTYKLFGYRYAINASAGNAKIAFALLNRYRMYRRQGMEVVYVGNTDWQLARESKRGLLVKGRFGGAMELANAIAKITRALA